MKRILILTVAVFSAATLSASAADAKANWEEHCQKCHGADGKGETAMGKKLKIKDYTEAKFQSAFKDEELLKVILEGAKDKESGKQVMKGYAETLTADENKAFIPFIRAFGKK